MRVHGDKVVARRTEVVKREDYRLYLPELREDFKQICGYCGKSEKVVKMGKDYDISTILIW